MKRIELKEFIKTGEFDKIRIGISSKKDVIDLMGNDYDFGDFGDTQIIKYGWYEFFYWTESEIIFGIQNDHLQFDGPYHEDMIEYQNDHVQVDYWFLKVNENVTFSEVLEILNEENLQYQFEKQSFEGAVEYLKLDSGITIDFETELTSWTYDELKGEWDRQSEPIKDQKDYILNGIRHFKY